MATAAKHQQQTTTTAATVVRGSSPVISPTSSSSLSSVVTSPKIKSPTSPIGSSSSPSSLLLSKTTSSQNIGFLSSSSSLSSPSGGAQSPLNRRSSGSTIISSSSKSSFIDTDEDIATIAKQISDHAEAIYQTWKARGLAPTEILNCHTDTAGDAFGKALTPPSRNSLTDSSPVAEFLANSPDMSNNNLEKLVSSFVNEDKARQQAARKNVMAGGGGGGGGGGTGGNSSSSNSSNSGGVILTSGTIRDALRKFEGSNAPAGYIKPNFLIKNSSSSTKTSGFQKNSSGNQQNKINTQSSSVIVANTKINPNNPLSTSLVTIASETTSLSSTHLSQSVPDVLIDTINQGKQLPKTSQTKTNLKVASSPATQQLSSTTNTSPTTSVSTPSSLVVNSNNSSSGSINSSSILSNSSTTVSVSSNLKKPQTPAKPANLINHTPSWPLKNRLNIGGGGTGTVGATTGANTNVNVNAKSKSNVIGASGSGMMNKNGIKDTTDDSSNNISQIKSVELVKKSADLLDEVSREEERLINALKTGIVLNNSNDSKLPEVITSTLNDNNKSGHYNRAGSWIKKSNNSSASSLQQRASVGVKVASSTTLTSSLDTTTSSSPGGSTTGTSSLSLNTAPLTQNEQQNQQQSRSGSSPQWNDDLANNKTAATLTTTITNSSDTIVPLPLGSTASTTTTANLTTVTTAKTETMSPAPALAPTKFKIRPKNDAAVPHPEAKQNSNNQNNYVNSRTNIINPVRPFLTRGSVAERVLMFEKCPDVKAPLRNINRIDTTKPSKIVIKPSTKATESPPPHTTLQRHIRSSSAKNVYIPKFHFPHGKPLPTIAVETTIQRLKSAFDSFPNNQVTKDDFHHILKICSLPFYWRMPLMQCTQHSTSGLVDGYRFIEFWKGMNVYCHDQYSRFVYILSRGQRSRPYILHEDLASLVQDVVDTHPGLAFLKEAAEFHSRYVHTVIARIFYSVNRSWSGKITVPELRRSNLLQVIQLLEEEEDINQIMAFFSYEHFYVIYCKFWELDRDHDLFIDQNDLARHNDHSLSTRIIERIFSGCVTRGGKTRISGPSGPKLSYTDFVWFLLSEEDKTNPTAIEYWFRCMDLDGDGIISMYELEYFYEEQQQRMESIGIETLPFEDCLCQMLDMIKPAREGCITLGDLKRCRMTPIFFDTFFNLEKYLEHEQRDPFATQRDNEDGMTDWDRYAAQEYELLVAEEGGDTQGSYDEDDEYESNIDILESQLDDMSNIINEW